MLDISQQPMEVAPTSGALTASSRGLRPGYDPHRWCGAPVGPGTGWPPTRRCGADLVGARPHLLGIGSEQVQRTLGISDRDRFGRQQPRLVASIDAVLELSGLGKGLDRPQPDRSPIRGPIWAGRRTGRPAGRGDVAGRGRRRCRGDPLDLGRCRCGCRVTGALAGHRPEMARPRARGRWSGLFACVASLFCCHLRSPRPVTTLAPIGLDLATG